MANNEITIPYDKEIVLAEYGQNEEKNASGVITKEGMHTRGLFYIVGDFYEKSNYTKLYETAYRIDGDNAGYKDSNFAVCFSRSQQCITKAWNEFIVHSDGSLTSIPVNSADYETEAVYEWIGSNTEETIIYPEDHYFGLYSSGYQIYHRVDGTCKIQLTPLELKWYVYDVTGLASGGNYYIEGSTTGNTIVDLQAFDRSVTIVRASDFTDESNPYIAYRIPPTATSLYKKALTKDGNTILAGEDRIVSVQAALSFDGETADIAYRDIPMDDIKYSFDLTDAERELLRQKAQGSNTVPIYYLMKIVRAVGTEEDGTLDTAELISTAKRMLTITGCEPQLNPTVKDIHARTLELTGNENKFIRYCSTAQFNTGAAASKYATIVSQSVINGTHTVNNLSSGTIEEVDSNTFYFSVTDSRGLTTRDFIVVDLVPYIKPTCKISKARLNTEGVLSFTVTGNYYNGSFGAKSNSLEFEYYLKEKDAESGSWTIAEVTPSFSGDSYTINYSISGLDYLKKYILIVNIIDEIKSAQTNPEMIASIPVYDWSETDFRHRTDVHIDKGKKIISIDENDNKLDVIAVDDNLTIGNSTNDTTIQGNNISLTSNNPIKLNNYPIGVNKVLWSGASHMNANQSITLSEAISSQVNGIVLVFSLYRNSSAEDVSINSFFISKKEVELLSGAPHSFFMLVNAGFSILGAKYLYISDTAIAGHEGNTQTGTNSGIIFNNSNYVLRYVIGC